MTLYRHVVKGTFPGESWSCTLHSTGTLSVSAANAAWATAWGVLWNGITTPADNINQLISSIVETTQFVTAVLDPVSLKQTSLNESTAALLGTAATTSLPPQDSCVITWRTATPTRGGRGRMYLPVFASSALTQGLLNSASQTIVAKAGFNLLNSLSGAGLQAVLLNRTTQATTVITGGDVGNVIDTQRRRRDKLVETRVTLVAG